MTFFTFEKFPWKFSLEFLSSLGFSFPKLCFVEGDFGGLSTFAWHSASRDGVPVTFTRVGSIFRLWNDERGACMVFWCSVSHCSSFLCASSRLFVSLSGLDKDWNNVCGGISIIFVAGDLDWFMLWRRRWVCFAFVWCVLYSRCLVGFAVHVFVGRITSLAILLGRRIVF
ncbi:hypothetical protein V6N13_059123 [Hibiscus sabdariffa]